MHEYGLMEDVVASAVEVAQRQGSRPVARIRLDVGELVAAEPEALQTAFEALSRGTVLEGAQLDLRDVPGHFLCESCAFRGSVADGVEPTPPWLCPECGQLLVPTAGRGIVLAEIAFR